MTEPNPALPDPLIQETELSERTESPEPNDAIINPFKGDNALHLPPFAVMVSSGGDLHRLCKDMSLLGPSSTVSMSRIYLEDGDSPGFSITGPMVGAPYAVLIMETLIAWGAREIFFFGWCGSISDIVKTGDMIVPTGAMIEEGTSPLYAGTALDTVPADEGVAEKIGSVLEEQGLAYHRGTVWSTDAVYRETREKVAWFQSRKVLAVEMELSALFTVARYRGVRIGAALAVSDELADLTWRPGFKDKRFKTSRKAMMEVIRSLCRKAPQNIR